MPVSVSTLTSMQRIREFSVFPFLFFFFPPPSFSQRNGRKKNCLETVFFKLNAVNLIRFETSGSLL